MPAPTEINQLRLTLDAQWVRLDGVLESVLDPRIYDLTFNVGRGARGDSLYMDATSAPVTKEIFLASADGTIKLGVIVPASNMTLVITGSPAASTQPLAAGVPYFVHENSTMTKLEITLASGTGTVLYKFFKPTSL